MELKITLRHSELTEGIREAVARQSDRLIANGCDARVCDVVISMEHADRVLLEASVFPSHGGNPLFAKIEDRDLYQGLSGLFDRLLAQFRRVH